MSQAVYLFDPAEQTVVGIGKTTDDERDMVYVEDEELLQRDDLKAIPKAEFYEDEAVQGSVPKENQLGTQIHVRCMNFGFDTVYGIKALIPDGNTYPQTGATCQDCGENVWKEMERKNAPCDWSKKFEWAEPPDKQIPE
jgi:hypothetical protein